MPIPSIRHSGCCDWRSQLGARALSIFDCGGTPASTCFELAVAGVSDDVCSNCTNWNGTFILERVPGYCDWRYCSESVEAGVSSPCNTREGAWEIITAGIVRQLRAETYAPGFCGSIATGASAIYLLDSTFNMLGDTVWNLDSYSVSCQGWPSQLTTTVPSSCP